MNYAVIGLHQFSAHPSCPKSKCPFLSHGPYNSKSNKTEFHQIKYIIRWL